MNGGWVTFYGGRNRFKLGYLTSYSWILSCLSRNTVEMMLLLDASWVISNQQNYSSFFVSHYFKMIATRSILSNWYCSFGNSNISKCYKNYPHIFFIMRVSYHPFRKSKFFYSLLSITCEAGCLVLLSFESIILNLLSPIACAFISCNFEDIGFQFIFAVVCNQTE